MHDRWQLLVVMALALGAFGGDNNPTTEPSAAAAISTATTTIQPPTATEPTPAASTTNPPGMREPDESSSPGGEAIPAAGQEQTDHLVVPGENLWTIARDRLAQVRGRHPADFSDREIATYWLRVIEANRDRLVSGDPDLIYPHERIALPPFD
jgi:nucleoid-associated protein YgaU